MRYQINQFWYEPRLTLLALLLLPFSVFFAIAVRVRRWLYRKGYYKVFHANVPVIVVGNISVGGTGKTPFVIWLASFLRKKGYKPGIVSRGVGGKNHQEPHLAVPGDKPAEVGDEALLILRHSGCPMVVCADRAMAIQHLCAQTDVDIIISDDGLQHYAMARNIEIAIVDGMRRLGNRFYLPRARCVKARAG